MLTQVPDYVLIICRKKLLRKTEVLCKRETRRGRDNEVLNKKEKDEDRDIVKERNIEGEKN